MRVLHTSLERLSDDTAAKMAIVGAASRLSTLPDTKLFKNEKIVAGGKHLTFPCHRYTDVFLKRIPGPSTDRELRKEVLNVVVNASNVLENLDNILTGMEEKLERIDHLMEEVQHARSSTLMVSSTFVLFICRTVPRYHLASTRTYRKVPESMDAVQDLCKAMFQECSTHVCTEILNVRGGACAKDGYRHGA